MRIFELLRIVEKMMWKFFGIEMLSQKIVSINYIQLMLQSYSWKSFKFRFAILSRTNWLSYMKSAHFIAFVCVDRKWKWVLCGRLMEKNINGKTFGNIRRDIWPTVDWNTTTELIGITNIRDKKKLFEKWDRKFLWAIEFLWTL